LLALTVVGAAAAGCSGLIGDGDGGTQSSAHDGGTPPVDKPPTSSVPTVAAPSPLGRLTALQYQATVRDLFAPITVPEWTLPPDSEVEGFTNNAAGQTPSSALIQAYDDAATAITTAAMQKQSTLLGCTPTSRADEDACAKSFFQTFGKKAYRHPLSAAELDDLVSFYTSTRMDGTDFTTAMTLSIETILQAVQFLYRIEVGTPSQEKGRIDLTSYELASRLSYFLWNSMPDDALLAAADKDELKTAAGVETQARRLLADQRSHDAVVRFHHEWLRFNKMAELTKDKTMFPTWSDDVANAMRESADQYVASVFYGEGTLTALLTDDHAWVNDALAPVYDVKSPGGSTLQLVQVDANERAGILTNAGVMASFANPTADSPVLRGVWILDRWMCQPPPPKPKNVKDNSSPDPTHPLTTRDVYATQHEQGACAGCHHSIDGIGFGFEHYDAIGKWRTVDNGQPVDASGWFPAAGSDLAGETFDGAPDLGQKLASSTTVQACVATQWLRYALGVDHTGVGSDDVGPVFDAFVKKNLDMRELVVAVTTSSAFRTRLVGP
jgi:hypothetical protein